MEDSEVSTQLEKLKTFFDYLDSGETIAVDGEKFCAIPIKEVSTFIGNYKKLGEIFDSYLQFQWGLDTSEDLTLSGGENSFYDLFSRVHDKAGDLKYGESILILLDEAELGFHPEWQRKYLNIITELLPEILPSKAQIQIILSTHSPFILSDLPKENVIFLNKDEKGKCKVHDGLKDKKQSFGANIHTLLSDGFFMDSLIGEFAKGKIDKVIKFLNGERTDLTEEEVKKTIDMIGEPILRRELQRRMKLRSVDALKTQVADLEARIKELENKDQ